jgi:hypothetical protein
MIRIHNTSLSFAACASIAVASTACGGGADMSPGASPDEGSAPANSMATPRAPEEWVPTRLAVPASAAEEMIDRTIVTLHPDGTQTVRQVQVPKSQSDAEKAARAAREANPAERIQTPQIAQDGSCAPASIWLFASAGETGTEICFSGQGTADLRDYCQLAFRGICLTEWIDNVGSYWPGSEDGSLYIWPCKTRYNCTGPVPFNAWGPRTDTVYGQSSFVQAVILND